MTALFQDIPQAYKNALFDKSQFRADLTLSFSPVPAYKKCLRQAQAQLDQWFHQQQPIEMLVYARAWLMDQVLTLAWEHHDWDGETAIALLAVGGYGRAELHPGSDIDILILLDSDNYQQHQPAIESFLTLLWDMGLKVGSSVRSLAESARQAQQDLSIVTNLMEARLICGPAALYQQLQVCIDTQQMWPSPVYLQAKFEEQRLRHRKYSDTEHSLEPSIKDSPGGLRDLHMLGWVAKRHYGTHDPAELLALGFLTRAEHRLLIKCRAFLWKIRWALHRLHNRCEDRLLFDYQKQLACHFGFTDQRGALAVEQFMKRYFRTVMAVTQLKDLLLQHFDDDILKAHEPGQIQPLNRYFQVRNNYIEARHPRVFVEHPPALLELFVQLTRSPQIIGVRAHTIRLLREHRHLIDKAFRQDPRCTRLFLELMHAPCNLTATLRRMSRYGILGRYLPEYGRIIGLMQFDLFHTHTVDAHTLLLIKYLRRFAYRESEQLYPIASKVIRQTAQPRLLYIAGLYHDIAKGQQVDHSQQGALEAERFCRRHGLDNEDSQLVAWLVKAHLVMSITAQKQDISDPMVIQAFARQVGTPERLDYLYLLTVADINATNPGLWNGWRAALLQQLYTRTQKLFKRGVDNLPRQADMVEQVKEEARALLGSEDTQLWQRLEPEYFIRHDAAELAWQLRGIQNHGTNKKPLIMIGDTHSGEAHGGSKIFIYTSNQPNLFAATVAALDQMHLLIQDARIFTSTDNFGLDTFTVLERDGSAIGNNPERIRQIQHHLSQVLTSPERFPELIKRRTPRQLRHFSRPPKVLLSCFADSRKTLLSLTATDRPGLLALIGKTFMALGIEVHSARIATFGEKVDDHFLISSTPPEKLHEADYCQAICTRISQVLKTATERDSL